MNLLWFSFGEQMPDARLDALRNPEGGVLPQERPDDKTAGADDFNRERTASVTSWDVT